MANPKPRPLDLKKLREKIDEKIKVVSMLGHLYIDGEYKGYVKDKEPLVVFVGVEEEDVNNLLDEIKQSIKSACEFYLRYVSDPLKLEKEYKHRLTEEEQDFLEYIKNEILLSEGLDSVNLMFEYNNWLFRLAFKDVLGGDKDG